MSKDIRVLSLFDGISVAQQALKELGYKPEYDASEVDKYAMTITHKNHPDTRQVGDVRQVTATYPGEYDLLIGGSPCQDLSVAKANREGLQGKRSSLFYEYVRILNETQPKYFVLENVASMNKENRDLISAELGVEPIMIDAALVSAQSRKRYFWTNIPGVEQPDDRGILLKDIIEYGYTERDKSLCVDASYYKGVSEDRYMLKSKRQIIWKDIKVWQYRRTYWREFKTQGKSPTLTANMGTGGNNVPYIGEDKPYRKLTVTECERLQSLPDGYTDGVSNTQRYKAIGNAFNMEVVKHILSHAEI